MCGFLVGGTDCFGIGEGLPYFVSFMINLEKFASLDSQSSRECSHDILEP